jgi:hypothetical protein
MPPWSGERLKCSQHDICVLQAKPGALRAQAGVPGKRRSVKALRLACEKPQADGEPVVERKGAGLRDPVRGLLDAAQAAQRGRWSAR